jgi:hypothetical protein
VKSHARLSAALFRASMALTEFTKVGPIIVTSPERRRFTIVFLLSGD